MSAAPVSQSPSRSDQPALAVEDLSVEIWTPEGTLRAVDGVSVSVKPGQTLAVLGESGCGKSTLARAIVGLLDPVAQVVSGAVRLNGTDLRTLSRAGRRERAGRDLAIVFQDSLTALNPVQKVGRQVAEPFRIHQGLSRAESMERAIDLLGRVGIPEPRVRANLFPHQFSGGMRQRALIAMAVALRPSVLIADEPTTALDVTVQAQIMELLRELQDEVGMAVVLITHDLGVAAEQAHEVAVMYAGRVVESGPTGEILAEPRHPYTQALLNSVPTGAAHAGGRLRTIEGGPPDLRLPIAGCRFHPRCQMARATCREVDPPRITVGPDRTSACLFWEELVDVSR